MSTDVRPVAHSILAAVLLFVVTLGSFADETNLFSRNYLSDLSASGRITLIPVDSWYSGDFTQLMSVINPFSTEELLEMADIEMESSATTIYEGDLWLKKSGLSLGMQVHVDDNFIGKFDRFVGYLGYRNYTVRLQTSQLSGTLYWNTDYSVSGMPNTADFDNSLISVDLLYYPRTKGSEFYYGIGYISYEMPVTLESLVLNAEGEIVYGNLVYQPDMKFSIYSFLFGFDTMQTAFLQIESDMNTGDGFGFWAATQDRFGVGMSVISEEAQAWIETANPGRLLYDDHQITMMVDYNLTLGARWTGDAGPLRLGAGLGYNIGGHVIMAMSSAFQPISRTDQVDASPNIFLFHHGLVFSLSTSW